MRLPPARLTGTLLAVSALVFLGVLVTGTEAQASFAFGFIPARLSGLLVLGNVPVWLTPLTATLLHGGLLHLGMNMLMLVFCGRAVEPVIRARGMAAIYLISAYAAAAAQWAWSPADPTPMIGASGAISGVLATYALLYGERRVRAGSASTARWLQILWLATAWVGINLLISLASADNGFSIAVPAHVGGFVAGLLLTRPMLRWRFSDRAMPTLRG